MDKIYLFFHSHRRITTSSASYTSSPSSSWSASLFSTCSLALLSRTFTNAARVKNKKREHAVKRGTPGSLIRKDKVHSNQSLCRASWKNEPCLCIWCLIFLMVCSKLLFWKSLYNLFSFFLFVSISFQKYWASYVERRLIISFLKVLNLGFGLWKAGSQFWNKCHLNIAHSQADLDCWNVSSDEMVFFNWPWGKLKKLSFGNFLQLIFQPQFFRMSREFFR